MAVAVEAAMAAATHAQPGHVHVDVSLRTCMAFLWQRCWMMPAMQEQLMHWVYRCLAHPCYKQLNSVCSSLTSVRVAARQASNRQHAQDEVNRGALCPAARLHLACQVPDSNPIEVAHGAGRHMCIIGQKVQTCLAGLVK